MPDAVAASADDVEGIGGGVHPQHLLTHGAHGAGDLGHRFATHPQRHEEPADLRGRRLARHHDVEGLLGFSLIERLGIGHLGDQGF